MCYDFPCGWWNGWEETCSNPRGEECPDDDDDIFPEEHVMAFLRGLLEEAMEKQPCD